VFWGISGVDRGKVRWGDEWSTHGDKVLAESAEKRPKYGPQNEANFMQNVMANIAVSVSELKKNPTAVLSGAHGQPVAVLNHNKVMGYMVPADVFEAMIERLDDLDLIEMVEARQHETPVPVDLDDL
jgi:antitoxin StbD